MAKTITAAALPSHTTYLFINFIFSFDVSKNSIIKYLAVQVTSQNGNNAHQELKPYDGSKSRKYCCVDIVRGET